MTAVAARELAYHVGAAALRTGVKPPSRDTGSEWADEHRMMSAESSPLPGHWRTALVPYTREIMDTLTNPFVRKVVWVAASQVGKTEVVNNYVGRVIHQDPAPMLIVQPSLDMAKIWSKDRLAPMLRDTPVLRGRVSDARSRDSGNTTLHKTFPGGRLAIVGANSAAGLSSRPIRDALFDEVDRYPPSAGTEGDPISLGEQRTRAFWNRKHFFVSSPGELRESRIWPEWLDSDQRRFFVPCPHCGEHQVLGWSADRPDASRPKEISFGGVCWESEQAEDGGTIHHPETAAYACIECGVLIYERHKPRMLALGEWRPTNPHGKYPGFHISALYSPFVTWAELAAMWLTKKRSQEELKTFINLQLGEPWEERDTELEPEQLAGRAEKYSAEVPDGVGVLTSAVDVQDDRLEVAVKGFGAGEESWLIAHHRIHGDPEQDEVWQELERILTKPYRHESGRELRIRAAMIDSGHLATKVYSFVRGKERRGVYAIKGADSRVRDPLTRAKKKNRQRVKPWTINTRAFKTIVFRRLRLTASTEVAGGPGYMHFCPPTKTGADAEYFAQFGAEIVKLVRRGRRFVRDFVQVRDRNEAIDLEVYALAALYSLGDPVVKRLGELAEEARKPPEDEPDAPARPGRRGTGWIRGGRGGSSWATGR